ncbi:MAG TPA: alpha/beta hydrolase [Streptosporangiaceae bacterium]|nr:alpha/beta hydrolase [Streptosporangiaceae bacterium]
MSRRPEVAAAVAWQHRVQTPAASLFAVELGQGRPLLFLHGITANAFVWRPVMERLSARYRAVAIDQRGHGRSSLGRDGRFDAGACARDVTDVAAALRAGPVVLVGHSLGARNAIAAAARRPDLVAGVVAIDFTPFIAPAAFDALDTRVAGGARTFGDAAEVTAYLAERYPRLPPDAVARRARHGYAPDAQGRLRPLADAGAMRATCAGLRADLAPDLSAMAVPAVLVRGADSAFVSAAAFEAARALRPDLRAVVVAGADHYVPEEQPGHVAQIIGEFSAEAFEGSSS